MKPSGRIFSVQVFKNYEKLVQWEIWSGQTRTHYTLHMPSAQRGSRKAGKKSAGPTPLTDQSTKQSENCRNRLARSKTPS